MNSSFSNFSSKRLVYFSTGPEAGKKVESAVSPEAGKEKSDLSSSAGREKIYQRAEQLIAELKQKAQAMKDAHNEVAVKGFESKARRVQMALDNAREEEKDFRRGGLDSDSGTKYATEELLKRMDTILHPAPASGKAPSTAELSVIGRELDKIDSSMSVKAPVPKPEAPVAPVKGQEKNLYNPPNEVKVAARNFVSGNPGFNGSKQFSDANGVVWEAVITGNDLNKQAKLSYHRLSLPEVKITA